MGKVPDFFFINTYKIVFDTKSFLYKACRVIVENESTATITYKYHK